MFKSIRWMLQIWHAGLLMLVLIGFGVATYFTTSRARYRQIDAELERSAQMLARGLWIHPEFEPPKSKMPATAPVAGRREHETRRIVLDVPPALTHSFGDGRLHGRPYFVVWHGNSAELATSSLPEAASEVPDPRADVAPPARWEPWQGPQPPRFRQRGEWREVFVFGQYNIPVLVGKSIEYERLELRHLALTLALTGVAVLVVGLGGGWFLSKRVIRPIHDITETSKQISAVNLSQRIDATETKSELGQLAIVLNEMFGRLEAAFQEQVRFTADASHELRTPLAVIHTNAQVCLTRDRTVEEYRKAMEVCLRASMRMKDLVDTLLLLAGVDSGRLVLERTPFDLKSVTSECLAMVAPLALERNVTMESDLGEASLVGDESRIAQVITNLLTNAIRYNRAGGHVHVSTDSHDGNSVLTVTDSGIGIPLGHQPHVFKRFYRVDSARSRAAGGSGLGLSICRSIIEAHGGSITFVSEEGKGTTFTVKLPGMIVSVLGPELSAV